MTMLEGQGSYEGKGTTTGQDPIPPLHVAPKRYCCGSLTQHLEQRLIWCPLWQYCQQTYFSN